jgi:hypothetical protein
MPSNLITLNKNKLPKVAPVGQVFFAGDEGQAYLALPPDGKLMRVDRLENYVAQQRGPAGERGPKGDKGEDSQVPGPPGLAGKDGKSIKGDRGPAGRDGFAATVKIGKVTTVPYGRSASVTNSGTVHDAILDFVIPEGRPGNDGVDGKSITGPRGEQGARADILYVDDAEVKAAAELLRDEKKRWLAALLRAKMAAGALTGEHSRRMTQHILDTLEKDIGK